MKIYYTLDLTEAILLKDHLVQNGIAADVRDTGAVRIPYAGLATEVWIADDGKSSEARKLVRDFLARQKAAGADRSSWICRRCREENPSQFEFCWNCERAKAGDSAEDRL